MNILSKVSLFFLLFYSGSVHANTLSAIAGFGGAWITIPVISAFLSTIRRGDLHNLFHDFFVVLIVTLIPISLFLIAIVLDKYSIRNYVPHRTRIYRITLLANSITILISLIIFTALPIILFYFPFLYPAFAWWSLLTYPLLWIAMDIAVYGIILHVMAPAIKKKAILYRLFIFDIVPALVVSFMIWFPFLLLIARSGG